MDTEEVPDSFKQCFNSDDSGLYQWIRSLIL